MVEVMEAFEHPVLPETECTVTTGGGEQRKTHFEFSVHHRHIMYGSSYFHMQMLVEEMATFYFPPKLYI